MNSCKIISDGFLHYAAKQVCAQSLLQCMFVVYFFLEQIGLVHIYDYCIKVFGESNMRSSEFVYI